MRLYSLALAIAALAEHAVIDENKHFMTVTPKNHR